MDIKDNDWKEIFHESPTGIVVTDKSGLIQVLNKHVAKLLEMDEDTLKGQHLFDILRHPVLVASDYANVATRLSCEPLELPIAVDYDRTAYTLLSCNPLPDKCIWSLKNFTQIKETALRAQELQRQIMESAYRDGVAENAVSVLHNIGNVLTAMLGRISTAKSTEQMELANQLLAKISGMIQQEEANGKQRIAKPLSPLLSELLRCYQEAESEFSNGILFIKDKCRDIDEIVRAQQRFANYKDRALDQIQVNDVISNCLTLHKHRLEGSNIQLVLELAATQFVSIEHVGLSQTISNLIVNAIEAINERINVDPFYNERTLHIASREAGDFVEVAVTDNGIGINPENLEKLAKFGFSTKMRGSGFGLHNCANFMRSNRGNIAITSPGVHMGATVSITCPLTDKKAAA